MQDVIHRNSKEIDDKITVLIKMYAETSLIEERGECDFIKLMGCNNGEI